MLKIKIDRLIEGSFLENNIKYQWIIAGDASFESVQTIEKELHNEKN